MTAERIPQMSPPTVSGDAPPTTVSVVISAYTEDRWDELCEAVGSVRAQTVAAHDIVVVVDQNEALLQRLTDQIPGLRVVPNQRRPGLAGARNTGALQTSGDVIAYLDDDAYADPTWIEELTKAYQRPGLLGVGGHISPRWATARPRWFPPEFDWVVGSTYVGLPDQPARIRNPIGANMSVRREVFEAIDGFREQMGRLEETDFCIRAQERFPDLMWFHWPAAQVHHHVSSTRERWSFFVQRCHNEGLAKATMVRMTSRETGLASERRYVRVTLPLGVVRGIGQGLRGNPDGLLRAGAIIAGLAATVAGYVKGLAQLRRSRGLPPELARRGETP